MANRADPPYASPHSSASDPVQLSGAGEIAELLDRASIELARDREAARQRGPVARILLVLAFFAGFLAISTMVYGMIKYPDAPLRQTVDGYSGKNGTPRTREDYESFLLWQRTMLTVFPSVFVLGIGFVIADARHRNGKSS